MSEGLQDNMFKAILKVLACVGHHVMASLVFDMTMCSCHVHVTVHVHVTGQL